MMDQGFYRMIREAVLEYVQRTGQSREDCLLIVNPFFELLKPIGGYAPKKIVGVEIRTHEDMDEESFLVIPRNEIEHVDEMIAQLYDDDIEGDSVSCTSCGHPMNLLLAGETDAVTCPWCHTRNTIEF